MSIKKMKTIINESNQPAELMNELVTYLNLVLEDSSDEMELSDEANQVLDLYDEAIANSAHELTRDWRDRIAGKLFMWSRENGVSL